MGFVLTYTKADFNTEIFMDISIEFGVEGVIWLDKNIYGIKDTDLTWFEKNKEGLESREVAQSQVDPWILHIE